MCEDLIKKLEDFKKEFKQNMRDGDSDFSELMSKIIGTTSKHPEQKEIVELMVLLQDYMARDNRNIKNNLIDSIEGIIDYKIEHLKKISDKQNDLSKTKSNSKIIVIISFFKELFKNKIVMGMFFIGFLLLLYIFFPKETDHFFKEDLPKIVKIL